MRKLTKSEATNSAETVTNTEEPNYRQNELNFDPVILDNLPQSEHLYDRDGFVGKPKRR